MSTMLVASPAETPPPAGNHRVLIVDDQPEVRRVCRLALSNEGVAVTEVGTGPDAIKEAGANAYDLVLLDVDLPGMNGEEVMRELRLHPPAPFLKVIMLSGRATGDDLSRILLAGADDFLTKPFSLVQLRARVQNALRLKAAQDRTEVLNSRLNAVNSELELNLSAKDGELLDARGALVLTMAKLIEHRSAETGPHLMRVRHYCRILGEAAKARPGFATRIDDGFVKMLEDAAPLHDIGKIGVPDQILNKPGSLTPAERRQMERHTEYGADTLTAVACKYRFATGFFHMGIEIARSHHERWDGTGYPDHLSGESIPLAARLLAVADVYDALRSPRVYKLAYSHDRTVRMIADESPGHFDPALVDIFRTVAHQFDTVFAEVGE
jgi:putative two-component system response regulator